MLIQNKARRDQSRYLENGQGNRFQNLVWDVRVASRASKQEEHALSDQGKPGDFGESLDDGDELKHGSGDQNSISARVALAAAVDSALGE